MKNFLIFLLIIAVCVSFLNISFNFRTIFTDDGLLRVLSFLPMTSSAIVQSNFIYTFTNDNGIEVTIGPESSLWPQKLTYVERCQRFLNAYRDTWGILPPPYILFLDGWSNLKPNILWDGPDRVDAYNTITRFYKYFLEFYSSNDKFIAFEKKYFSSNVIGHVFSEDVVRLDDDPYYTVDEDSPLAFVIRTLELHVSEYFACFDD